MKRIVLITAVLFIFSTGMINAQNQVKSIGARQAAQQARIKEGIQNKELTRREGARLESEQRAIQVEKRIAKSDGKITPGERRILKQEQDRAGRDIYRQKHDAQIRG